MVETNKVCQSDWMYINTLIKNVYDIKGTKLSPVYMAGKGNYLNKEPQVNSLMEKYDGSSKVFICIDLDKVNSSPQDVELNDRIEKFCNDRGYILIWFKKHIEDVFLGRDVENSKKRKEADSFLSKNSIKGINLNSLEKQTRVSNRTSNILYELDKIDCIARK